MKPTGDTALPVAYREEFPMKADGLPSFLDRGTFQWSRLGYAYAETPPVNLLEPGALTSDDPWVVLAATLEQAKRGNHNLVGSLGRFVREDAPQLLPYACTDIIADAGLKRDHTILAELMVAGPPPLRMDCLVAGVYTRNLRLVPFMLAGLEQFEGLSDREFACSALSELLEAKEGPIAGGAALSSDKLKEIVNQRIADARVQIGTDTLPIWRGSVFSVRKLAEYMYDLVLSSEGEPLRTGLFIPYRHAFEASTGIDCSGFFEEGSFQDDQTLRILMKFLAGGEVDKYRDGIRYFFGHPIPVAPSQEPKEGQARF